MRSLTPQEWLRNRAVNMAHYRLSPRNEYPAQAVGVLALASLAPPENLALRTGHNRTKLRVDAWKRPGLVSPLSLCYALPQGRLFRQGGHSRVPNVSGKVALVGFAGEDKQALPAQRIRKSPWRTQSHRNNS